MQELKINKTYWEKVALGDVVFEPKETAKNIVAEGFAHIVGLEHIDSDDIHLRKSFPGGADTTFTKVFRKGDVLFGRRRAYLKKAAQATFDGVCSGDITVLRAKENLEQSLLPFIIHNEEFFDYAIKHSAGGLSPRVKFKDLANFEFLLPPKHQQADLAELLMATDEVIEKDLLVLERLDLVLKSLLKKTFADKSIIDSKEGVLKTIKSLYQTEDVKQYVGHDWKVGNISEFIVQANSGFAEGLRDINGKPQLRMNNVTRDGRINLKEVAFIPTKTNGDRYKINLNDVLFCNTNSDDLVGKTILADSSIDGFYYSNHFTRLVGNHELQNEYLYLYLKFLFDIGLFQRICVKWIGQAAVQLDSLLNIQILVPPLNEQKMLLEQYFDYLRNIELLESKIQASKDLQKSLINQLF